MALSEDLRAQLLQQLQQGEDLTEDQVVSLLNSALGDTDEFVRRSTLDEEEATTSFFQRFQRNDIVPNRRQIVTQGVWSEGLGKLTFDEMFSFNEQTSSESGKFFFEVYDKDPQIELEAARIQFSVAYGNESGGGSQQIDTNNVEALESTKAVYFQHKNVLFDVNETRSKFFETGGSTITNLNGGSDDIVFRGSQNSEDVHIINVQRARYKQKFDPGNWELRLLFTPDGNVTGSTAPDGNDDYGGGLNDNSTEKYSVVKLVDETATTDFNNEQLNIGNIGRRYRVLSGSLNLDNNATTQPDVVQPEEYSELSDLIPAQPYGEFYPDLGVIVLNPNMIERHAVAFEGEGPQRFFNNSTGEYDGYVSPVSNVLDLTDVENASASDYDDNIYPRWNSVRPITDTDGNYQNQEKLFNAVKRGSYFVGRSAEEIVSTNYFVRVRNTDFNFSNNPTFTNDDGTLSIEEFEGDPKVFITSVGLYDNDNNLVAVAKLSNPVEKSFQKESLISISLDY